MEQRTDSAWAVNTEPREGVMSKHTAGTQKIANVTAIVVTLPPILAQGLYVPLYFRGISQLKLSKQRGDKLHCNRSSTKSTILEYGDHFL